MSRKSLGSLLAVAAGLALLGACGYGSDDAGPASSAAVQPQAAQQAPTTLTVAEVAGLGQVVTDDQGRTLYRFGEDAADPPTSNCAGECAQAWPPVRAEGDVAVQGIDQRLLGTITRTDGSRQLTIKGWPVYRFAKDTPGQADGHGAADGAWAAVAPSGAPAVAAAEKPTGVATTDIGGLGTVLTDQNGMTLYLFTEDTSKPPKPTCAGECAQAWPPLLAEGEVRIDGVDPALVGSVARPDGTEQVTVGGWPVYRYAQDRGPGDASGHGVKDAWFALEPNGCKVSPDKKPTAAEPEEPTGNTGYGY